jgi:hypothetical protein
MVAFTSSTRAMIPPFFRSCASEYWRPGGSVSTGSWHSAPASSSRIAPYRFDPWCLAMRALDRTLGWVVSVRPHLLCETHVTSCPKYVKQGSTARILPSDNLRDTLHTLLPVSLNPYAPSGPQPHCIRTLARRSASCFGATYVSRWQWVRISLPFLMIQIRSTEGTRPIPFHTSIRSLPECSTTSTRAS